MDFQCVKCNTKIFYNPLGCEICGVFLCLPCSDLNSTEVVLCDLCADLQMASLMANEHVKCSEPGCKEWAIINQNCISTKTSEVAVDMSKAPKSRKQRNREKRENREKCPSVAIYCKKHIKKCSKCDGVICDQCFTNGGCWQDGITCNFCFKIFGPSLVRSCDHCNKFACYTCAKYQFDGNYYGHNYKLCLTHQEICHCAQFVYKIPQFLCVVNGCGDYSCKRGWFETRINTNYKFIHVCHKHISFCSICKHTFPVTNERLIRFRNGMVIISCTNCYKKIQSSVDGLLLSLNHEHIRVPRDVLSMIVGFIIYS